jgi:hypothetical protein
MAQKIFAAALALILTTVLFAEWMHQADDIDRSRVRQNLQAAFDDGLLLRYGYPHLVNPISRDNLSGLDGGAECFYVQMVLYDEEGHRRLSSLNPGYYKSDAGDFNCPAAENLIKASKEQQEDRSLWQIAHKPRLWHGVKALLLNALPRMHYSQLGWLIQLTTFFGLALFAVLVVAANRQVGFAYLPFVFSAYYCSAILFFGGVVYSTPLMAMILWGVVWLGYRTIFGTRWRTVEVFLVTAGGTLHSFFFQMDGAEIYAVSLVFFVEVFLDPHGPNRRSLLSALESCIFYAVGFVGSTVVKNLLVAVFAGSWEVFSELINNVATRTGSVAEGGRRIGLFEIVHGQFHWYGVIGYSIGFLYYFVNASKYAMLVFLVVTVMAVVAFFLRDQKRVCEQLLVGCCGVLLMLAVVIGRYMVLRQHSDIHIFFVNRYLFVFAGAVYFYGIWLVFVVRSALGEKHRAAAPPVH